MDMRPDLSGEEFRRLPVMEPKPQASYRGAVPKRLKSKIPTVFHST